MKNIKSIYWPKENNEQVHATLPGGLVEVDGEYFGDGIPWALEKDINGNVTAKHNLRYVESVIYWTTP